MTVFRDYRTACVCIVGILLIVAPELSGEQMRRESVDLRGRIMGIVTDAVTGTPVAGAYVWVDHSGDAGGANLERFRELGTYVTAETDSEGRYVLDGVAFDQRHPLYVTCSGYVRHEQTIALQAEDPEVKVDIFLKPASRIAVTMPSGEASVSPKGLWLRLTAQDDRLFVPMREDWPRLPYRLEKAQKDGTFVFGELDTGLFTIEALRIGTSEAAYCGHASDIEIESGETKTIQLAPPVLQTYARIKIAEDPDQVNVAGLPKKRVTMLICRNPDLLLWRTGKFYHPEDERLARIMSQALIQTTIRANSVYKVLNLAPGEYSVFAITIGRYQAWTGTPSAFVRGTQLTLSSAGTTNVEIPWRDPTGPSGGRFWALNRRVSLGAGQQTVGQLCEILTRATKPNLRIEADPAIQDAIARFQFEKMSVWDVLEALYGEKGWVVTEGQGNTLVLCPGQ